MSLSWYHGALPEPKANALLEKHGMADGLFLVRENRKETLVLSMAHEVSLHFFPRVKRQVLSQYFTRNPLCPFFILTRTGQAASHSHEERHAEVMLLRERCCIARKGSQ